ncbi:MAG: LPS export ABC transporter permease LptF [Betaproteobacteria bacterium]|nr:LPS export ABC transporter permease LptF [Betaproteobacteria bacterium]
MIFQRALLREFGELALAVFATLFAITLTTQLIRLLGQAASGRLISEGVLLLLGLSALNYLPVLLSLTLFVTVLMTLSRSYRDSEMVVWFSTGQSLLAWVKPVLTFAAPLVALIAALSLLLSPWAVEQSDGYRNIMDQRDEAARIAPGIFREASQADRVFFVEAIAGDDTNVQNVFVASMRDGVLGVMVARRGYKEAAANGDRFMVLLNGRRYQGTPGMADYKIMDFERYALRVETREAGTGALSTRALPTIALVRNPTPQNLGELVWRAGLPISALLLALLAIPLSFVNPRASRSVNLVFALLAYMVYSNLLSIAQAWVSQARVSFLGGWWPVHAGMLALLALLFYRRMRVGSHLLGSR